MPRRKDYKGKSKVPKKAIQTQEILRCGTDASYFINNYVKIPHPVKGMIPFNTFDFQDDCLKAFQTHNEVIVNKSRQLGLSTISAAYALWMALFQKERTVLVIATRLETAKLFLKKVTAMFESLPDWLVMPHEKARSVRYIEFSNGSRIKAEPTSPHAGRGESLSLLIVDEAAHVEGIEELWLAIQPTLSTGGSVIMISTPSGVGTLFHRTWEGAKNKENNFHPIELPWTVHPERDQAWFEKQRKSIIEAMGERGVAQELLYSFTASGDTFLRPDVLERILKQVQDPIAKSGPRPGDDSFWIWKYPETGHRYIIGADISRGNAKDFSAFHVIDTETDEVVAEYKGKIEPDKFGEYLVNIGVMYNNALICPEINQAGIATVLKLKELQYPNLYYQKLHKNMYMAFTNMDVGDELPGFETNGKTRTEITARLENVLRNQSLKVCSKRLYDELITFVWKNEKPQAQKGYNDDLVMALAIGNSLYEAGGMSYDSDDMAKAMLAGMSVPSNTMDTTNGNIRTSNTHAPPVMTDNSLHDYMQKARDQHSSRTGVQDFNSEYWKQFGWVLGD